MAINTATPLDRTFHALGDGTRRRIMTMLSEKGDLSAGQLQAPFNATQPTISKHIKTLERAGLVTRRVEGRAHIFSLNAETLRSAEDWICRHRRFWEGTLAGLEAFAAGKEDKE